MKYNEVERLVHKTIDRLTDLRIRQNREFFNVAPQIALDILKDIALTIDDAKIVEYEGNKPKLPEKASLPDEKRTPSNAYQRAKFFSYNGKILADLRKEMENVEDEESACDKQS